MTLPAVSLKTFFDAGGDDPAQARSQLATLCDNVNAIRTHLLTSTLTSGTSVLAAAGGLAVSGTDLLTSFGFVAKTANYTALAADRGKVINYTTAGFTLSLTAAATLGDGWWCIVVNSATSGNVTIDPNSSEIIDGATTILLLPGQSCIILCNGTLFRTIARPRQLTQDTEQTTSGSASYDFTGIPAGVKRITVMFDGITTNGTDEPQIQIGDSDGIETSGYVGVVSNGTTHVNITTGFDLDVNNAATHVIYGAIVLTLQDASNTWIATGWVGLGNTTAAVYHVAGRKTLSGTLDRVRLTTTGGTDAFDGGSVNIIYEF